MAQKRRGPTLPKTITQLKSWLRGSTEGKQVIADLTAESLEEKCRQCETAIRPKPKVLVVAKRLGLHPGAEVYAERGVSVRLEEMFDTEDDSMLELGAEEALAIRLPRPWQHLLCGVEPQQPTRGIVFSGMSAQQYVKYLEVKRVLREMKAWHEVWVKNGSVKTKTRSPNRV